MTSTGVDQVLSRQRLSSLRLGALLRLGAVTIMIGAMLVSPDPSPGHWQAVLVAGYGLIAVCAVLVVFSAVSDVFDRGRWLLILAGVDVAAIVGFKLLSPGGYMSLLIMLLLPRMLAVAMSWQQVAVLLALSSGLFAATVLEDPMIDEQIGAGEPLVLLMYGFVCATAILAVFSRTRQTNQLVKLTLSREELLAQIMTAAEDQRRQIAEAIHDGPLQDVLAARRDIADFVKTSAPAEPLRYALASLGDASRQLREVTFELHPAVLDKIGLAAAVEKLARVTGERSGIAITTDINYPDYREADPIDPMLFGVIRELLSNVARHSQASAAAVQLAVVEGWVRVDVTDNGIGISVDEAERRLTQGHIGLASHRARVEAAGGSISLIDEPVGAHIRVELPLRGPRGGAHN